MAGSAPLSSSTITDGLFSQHKSQSMKAGSSSTTSRRWVRHASLSSPLEQPLSPPQSQSLSTCGKTKRRMKEALRKTLSDSSDSGSELERTPCGSPPPRVRASRKTVQETSETTFEITINKCHDVHCPRHVTGPIVYNFTGPTILQPNLSTDLLFQLMSQQMNIPAEKFKEAYARLGNGNGGTDALLTMEGGDRTVQSSSPLPVAAEIAVISGAKVSDCVVDGEEVNLSQLPQTIGIGEVNVNQIDPVAAAAENDQQQHRPDSPEAVPLSSAPAIVEFSNKIDEAGNLKVIVRIKQTISTKITTAVDETSVIMGKACALTVLCGIFILAAWLVIEKYEANAF